MSSQCQALSQSDQQRCNAIATSKGNLFCQFHARQCFGLYKGYKRRNAQLDELIANPPAEIQHAPLHALDLTKLEDENVLERIHAYLQKRFGLLDRVIRARRLHHSHFYALNLDYGHEHYLNQLSAQRPPLLQAIQRVIKRLAEVLYRKKKWFDWVRRLEDEEEKERDAGKKKIKQEAALFKRHAKEVEARQKQLRAEEDEKRQSEYLNKVWEEQQAVVGEINENNVEDSWDPIENSIEDERDSYVDLLRHFLWLHTNQSKAENEIDPSKLVKADNPDPNSSHLDDVQDEAKSKNAKKRARQKARSKIESDERSKEPLTPGKVHIESIVEMRKRLREGQAFQDGVKISGYPLVDPKDIQTRTSPLDPEEIDQIINDVHEIKQLLFCRLLLAHAVLLPVALRSNTVDEFLADEEVNNTDLRDLCLKLEQPGLQDLRDACADLKRENEEEDPEEPEAVIFTKRGKHHAPQRLLQPIQTEREKNLKTKREQTMPQESGTIIDFGIVDDQDQFKSQKIKIKVCGRDIYNYPSEKAMSRGGWLQFSIIAKDCRLEEAVKLCRNWEEFHELIVLTSYNYFPASGWLSFLGGQSDQQLFKLGFFPVTNITNAEEYTIHRQTSRNQGPRFHQVSEMRNWLCGLMKRNDAASRRFIQYVAMQSSSMIIHVRDVLTGQVLVSPPEAEKWLLRIKVGMGRASKNEWKNVRSVDSEFIESLDQKREWRLEFKEYYEIIIWDLEPGQPYADLFNAVQASLFKARRVKSGQEIYEPVEHILRTITMAKDSGRRARDLRSDDNVSSIWDELVSPETKHKVIKTKSGDGPEYEDFPDFWVYNETDRLEDEVLFPWELTDGQNDVSGRDFLSVQQGPLNSLDSRGFDMRAFILDLDTDDELSDHDVDIEAPIDEGSLRRLVPSDDEDEIEVENDFDSDYEDVVDEELDDKYGTGALISEYDESGRDNKAESTALARMVSACKGWQNKSERRRAENETFITMSEKEHFDEMMNEEYELYQERNRAAAFKEAWHKVDLEPNAQQMWNEYEKMLKSLFKWLNSLEDGREHVYNSMRDGCRLLAITDILFSCHRRIFKDARLACGFVSLFFDDQEFLTGSGAQFKESLIFNQSERAKHPPDRRSYQSSKTRPRERFKEWDARKGEETRHLDDWDKITRPAIAWLYREGVIGNAYSAGAAGRAVCLTEPGRGPDLYFDWRRQVPYYSSAESDLDNPYKIDPLLHHAQDFAKQYPDSRFSVFKVWSAPHFWPLMLGVDRRHDNSFVDSLERTWEWKFIPKDMPYAEWSMHKTVNDRVESYEMLTAFEDAMVVSRIDTVLVMAKNVEACKLLTIATMFAINSKTWRMEVDPWKSWINVDCNFLGSLDQKWW